MIKKPWAIILLMLILAGTGWTAPSVRIKDLAHILQARDNQLMGFGLVVGLRNSGDSKQTGFTKQALVNLLSKMGVVPQLDFSSRNVAAVMVTATLPPFLKSGQKIDVTVSSMGDASSLKSGTLLITPLQGPDGAVYAVAQGKVLVVEDQVATSVPPLRRGNSTTGHIPGGALVEKEVAVTLAQDSITMVLDEADFTTASRMADAISKAGYAASAVDGATVKVYYDGNNLIKAISRIEGLSLVPDEVAKVVINERTGTIVMGENVRLAEAAVTYGGLSITVGGAVDMYSEGGEESVTTLRMQTQARFNQPAPRLVKVPTGSTLNQLVAALNAIKATPQDMIAILQALKKAGSLKAELEII